MVRKDRQSKLRRSSRVSKLPDIYCCNFCFIIPLFSTGKKNGFFIEAGAFDGELYSNTLLLEMRHNWTGLLVEPLPEAYQALLTKNRKAYSIETCLSTEKRVTQVNFDAAGLFGGIINGQFKPGDEFDLFNQHVIATASGMGSFSHRQLFAERIYCEL